MSSSNGPGEAEHLLGHHAPLSDQSTTIIQNEPSPTPQRSTISFEYTLEDQPWPADMNHNNTVVAGSEMAEDSSTHGSQTCRSIAVEEHTPGSNRQRLASMPWTLRKAPLLGFITSLIVLVVVLEVLYLMSNKYQGLASSGEDIYYLWKYGPTAILSFVAIYWSDLEYYTKISMPWVLMSKQPQSAARSLLLDYITPNFLVVIWKSARARHFPVLTAAVGSFMVISTTIASTGLFSLQFIEVEGDTTLRVDRSFDATGIDLSSVDASPVLLVSSILSGNLSVVYPMYTNEQFAVEWIMSPRFSYVDFTTSLTGLAYAFSADMTCVPGSTVNSSVTAEKDFWHVLVDVTDEGCTTGLANLATLQRDHYNDSTQTQAFTVGRAILQNCSDVAQPTLFMVLAQTEATAKQVPSDSTTTTSTEWNVTHFSMNTTVIVCTPTYRVQKAMVTVDSNGFLGEVELRPGSRNLTVSGWDLWSAVNHSLVAAGPAFLEGPITRDSWTGDSLYDEFFGVMISTWTRLPIEYLDPDTLIHDSQRLFNAVANQIAVQSLTIDSETNVAGVYKATRSRIVLLGISLRIVEAGIAIILVCTCLMIAYSPWIPHSEAGDNMATLAVILARSDRLKILLKESGIKNYQHISRVFAAQTFACINHNSAEGGLIQVYNSSDLPKLDNSKDDDPKGNDCFWRPSALSKLHTAMTFVIPLAIIASLEVTYRISHKNGDYGLADIPSDHRWHYTWTWAPALVMTVTKLLCQSVTSAISLLDPYSRLRRQTPSNKRAVFRSNLSKVSLQSCLESVQSRRWALLATAISALLGPFLTIVVSGLFFAQPTTLNLSATFPLADHIASPSEKYCSSSSWTQASLCAASLLDTGYGVYPRGTYWNLVYPLQQSNLSYTIMRGTRLFNASSIRLNVPVVVSNITCQAMDPAGFRYTLETHGLNNPAAWDSNGRYQGDLNGTHLNLTHLDLAGYQCKDSWLSCGDYACTNNGTRCTNMMPSLGFDLDPKKPNPFVNLLYASELKSVPLQWAHPTSWPNSSGLVQAIAARNTDSPASNPDLIVIYGSWIPGQLRLSGISCYFDILSGRADLTYQVNTTEVIDVQTHDDTFTLLPNTGNCNPWNSPDGNQLESFLPNNGSLWKTALNGSNATTFQTWGGNDLYSLDGAEQMGEQISRIYNNHYTQFYNTALRDHDMTDGSNEVTATVSDDNWERLVQSKVSTRILQALLATMWLCTTIALILFDAKNLLPKNPCSIAAQASLLVDSKFLDLIPPGAENATADELMQMTPFVDHEFSIGWWDDEIGGRRFGIDVGVADFDRDGDEVDEEEVEDSA